MLLFTCAWMLHAAAVYMTVQWQLLTPSLLVSAKQARQTRILQLQYQTVVHCSILAFTQGQQAYGNPYSSTNPALAAAYNAAFAALSNHGSSFPDLSQLPPGSVPFALGGNLGHPHSGNQQVLAFVLSPSTR